MTNAVTVLLFCPPTFHSLLHPICSLILLKILESIILEARFTHHLTAIFQGFRNTLKIFRNDHKIGNFRFIVFSDGKIMINHLSFAFCEKSEQVLHHFARYCQKTVLGDLFIHLFSRLYNVSTSSCAHLTII
jgi:hypothetical protein